MFVRLGRSVFFWGVMRSCLGLVGEGGLPICGDAKGGGQAAS